MSYAVRTNAEAFARIVERERTEFEWQRPKMAKVASILSSLAPIKALADVGCFTGLADHLFFQAGVERIDGYDVCLPALDVARTRGMRVARWRAGEEPCPRESGAYQVALALDVIEHVPDAAFFVAELIRITKPGGTLIVSTPNLGFWLNRIRLLMGKVPWSFPAVCPAFKSDPMTNTEHIRVTTFSEWKAFFGYCGLEVGRIETYSLLHMFGGMRSVLKRGLDALLSRSPKLAFGDIYVMKVAQNSRDSCPYTGEERAALWRPAVRREASSDGRNCA